MAKDEVHRRAIDTDEEWRLIQEAGGKPTVIKVEWWQVVLVFVAIIGYMFNLLYVHNQRLTIMETSQKGVESSLTRIETLAQDTNTSMHKHIENGRQ